MLHVNSLTHNQNDSINSQVCKFLKKQANFYLILLFLNVCKQTFKIPHVRISPKVF